MPDVMQRVCTTNDGPELAFKFQTRLIDYCRDLYVRARDAGHSAETSREAVLGALRGLRAPVQPPLDESFIARDLRLFEVARMAARDAA